MEPAKAMALSAVQLLTTAAASRESWTLTENKGHVGSHR